VTRPDRGPFAVWKRCHVSVPYGTTKTPVLPWATGDVCLHGRTVGLVGAGVARMSRLARGRSFQQWAHPSIQVPTNLKAFAASQHQGEDP
jgi:hypothetical protein